MRHKIAFEKNGFENLQYWIKQDKKITNRIFSLIDDIDQNPFWGLGKPEPLKNELQGYRSRRIDKSNRQVYKIIENEIIIISCRYHY
jgi:toxin YoeB